MDGWLNGSKFVFKWHSDYLEAFWGCFEVSYPKLAKKAKFGQKWTITVQATRELTLEIRLRESLRHLRRPPGLKGINVIRPGLKVTVVSQQAGFQLCLVKLAQNSQRKKLTYIFVNGLLANFKFWGSRPKFWLIKLIFGHFWAKKWKKNFSKKLPQNTWQ